MPVATRLLAAVAVLAASAAPALAEEAYFKTPSGNIHCMYDDYEGTAYVRCDISNYTPTMGKPPADCDLDWGGAFAIGASDRRGSVICHGDTVISPEARALAYGKSFRRGGINCLSEQNGLTCENAAGHGFFLSRARQRVF